MQSNYQQQIHRRNQRSAEVDALRLLWGGTMKHFTPKARTFETWLGLIGYAGMFRNINDVHRQFIRLGGMMLPGELIRYMDHLVARTLLSQRNEEKAMNACQRNPSPTGFRQHGEFRWKN
jgi:hypothetical protein